MFSLALVAKEFIVILLGEKWLESAEMMQILCIAGAFSPISGIFCNLLISRGHSTTFMRCSISQCIIQLLALVITSHYGIYPMIIVSTIINICWLCVWFYFSRIELNLNFFEVLKDISPYLFISSLIICLAHIITLQIDNLYLSFAFKILFVSSTYIITLWLLQSHIIKEVYLFIMKRGIKQ